MNIKYTKKPITIEAFQMTRERRADNKDWPEWLNEAWNKSHQTIGSIFPKNYPLSDGTDELKVMTMEGPLTIAFGDWIIRGIQGELYPCKPDIFAATYESADFIHKLEDGSPDIKPEVDEELVAYLGMTAELITTIRDHSNNLNIKQACERALQMAERLGEEHRSMYIPYSQMVKNLFAKMDSETLELLHAAVGISGESGELLDAVKKHWAYGKELDVQNVMEELGDLVFYMQAMMNMFGWTWADLRMNNRVKLAKRYPDGVYSHTHAQARLDKQEKSA